MNQEQFERCRAFLSPKKSADKEYFLDLLDAEVQRHYEELHVRAEMAMLRARYIDPYKAKIAECEARIEGRKAKGDYSAESVHRTAQDRAQIAEYRREIDEYRCFYDEPYFARMDLTDPAEGYNSYYIGKKGDINLEIVDWRAPLAKKYYQKSQINFSIREYDYKTILRRALRTKNGKLLDFQNEYLSVRDYLSKEEIAGRDEEIIFDPYLRQIIRERREETEIRDIIETIQEKQYEIITRPERENLIVQGCAGSGKTMVLLHRLSYLLYNNETLNTRDVLVITPSDSFNAFIDELAKVLELQTVKTMTLDAYFSMLLQAKGIAIPAVSPPEPEAYLAYLYSPACRADVQRFVDRVYDGVRGLFASKETEEFVREIRDRAERQLEAYTAVKNASLRIRRAVFGTIRETPEGGISYTKPFHEFMNGILAVRDFLALDFSEAQMQNDSYFTKQLVRFFRGAAFVVCNYEAMVSDAADSLEKLAGTIEKEIADLRRYRHKRDGAEVLTYADRIERRKEVLAEIDRMRDKIRSIGEDCEAFSDFYRVIRGDKALLRIASCAEEIDLARYFYRETVKKEKKKYGMEGLYRSDGYAISMIFTVLGIPLYPHYGYVFLDEGQDISAVEYELIRAHNPTAAINLFGDLEQNITPYRGIASWRDALPIEPFVLEQNYRNANQIVAFVEERLGIRMTAIGFDGDEVETISPRRINAFFAEKKGLKAVIVSESARQKYLRKSYQRIGETGRVSKTKINFMTVYESKGLEFSAVVVAEEGMTRREKYIAYTRALMSLAIIPAPQ